MTHHIFLTYCHEIVGVAMKWLVQQHFPSSAIEEAQNFQSALNDLLNKHYDLVVLDADIADSVHVLSTVKRIKYISPKTNILIFSELDEAVFGPTYLSFGINGFLTKKADLQSIIRAIQTALSGGIFWGNQHNAQPGEHILPFANPLDTLSARETQIVERLVKGHSLTDIGRKMNLRETTISTYKKRIFEKAGVKTLSDLIKIWKIYR